MLNSGPSLCEKAAPIVVSRLFGIHASPLARGPLKGICTSVHDGNLGFAVSLVFLHREDVEIRRGDEVGGRDPEGVHESGRARAWALH